MFRHETDFAVRRMCLCLHASSSGYYAWRGRHGKPGPRALKRQALDARVAALFNAFKGRYGAPRLTREVKQEGLSCNLKTVADSLRRQGLRARAARKFKATTNSRHTLPVSPNLLQQNFRMSAPNQAWAGDMTYLWTDEGWLYLAVMIDLYSRRVIGWAMSERMTADLVCDALQMALWKRQRPCGVIVHSDRGSQ